MTREDRRVLRRRLIALGVLLAVAGAVALIADPFADDEEVVGSGKVPEAGSRFRERGADQSLLDVLGPVLAAGAPAGDAARLDQPLDSAVASLFVVGFDGRRPSRQVLRRFRTRGWGALLVEARNVQGPFQLRGAVRAVEAAARRGRERRPLVIADPTELRQLAPPPGAELGTESPPAARDAARDAARRLRQVGVRAVLAPSADLGASGGPAEERSFGDDPQAVDDFVVAAAQGWRAGGVVPIPGRFPGEGAASQDPLEGPATVGLALPELLTRDLRPFTAAARTVPAIQMSAALFAAWDGVTPATVLPQAVRLLRRRVRFDRAVLSADLLATTAATGTSVGDAAVAALRAGCDVLVVPTGGDEQEEAFRRVLGAARRGEVPRPRLAEAVRRAAALRRAAGLR